MTELEEFRLFAKQFYDSLEKNPKIKGIKKSRSGHPKVSLLKKINPRTKRTAGNEPSAPRSNYTKTIKYKTY